MLARAAGEVLMKRSLCALAALIALSTGASAQTVLTIDEKAVIGTIRPEVYGQFAEHLGAGVYGGLWVGEDSKIPNTKGIRNDVFAALEALEIPVLRWPGGCFADTYHWRDGIGPRERRPVRVNLTWGGVREPNAFGTHEFFDLAERLGAKTDLNVNVGTGSAGEAKDWLEYITSDADATLANERRANGREKPWRVDYLSIGNEPWGCGGHLRAAAYADLYAQFATFAKTAGAQPVRIIAGSHDGNMPYSDEILDHPDIGDLAEGISFHFYTLPTGQWSDKGPATGFDEDQWASTLSRTLRMGPLIDSQLAMIDRHKLSKPIDLYPDEWGVWTNPEPGAPEGFLFQQNTIREAIAAALNFNIFHAHADRVPMTNIAQMVNVLQAMILTDGPEMLLTPTYHVYAMYKPFRGATALRVTLDSPVYHRGPWSFPALSASAALTKTGALVIALVNADPRDAHEISVPARGAEAASGAILAGDSLDAHNTFENKDHVAPKPLTAAARDGRFVIDMPPRSVAVFTIDGPR
jgi:alpha-N-arabinofuranosidase